jgi:hypothetical protein
MIRKIIITVFYICVVTAKLSAQIYYDTLKEKNCPPFFCMRLHINNYDYLYKHKINIVKLSPPMIEGKYRILWDTNFVKNLRFSNGAYDFQLRHPALDLFKIKICDSLGNCYYNIYNVLVKNKLVPYFVRPCGLEGRVFYGNEIEDNPIVGVMVNDTLTNDFKVVSFCLSGYSGLGDGTYFKRHCTKSNALNWDMLQLLSTASVYMTFYIENLTT